MPLGVFGHDNQHLISADVASDWMRVRYFCCTKIIGVLLNEANDGIA